MDLKEKLRELVKIVTEATGDNQEKIALELGYGKNYISEMLSPTGVVSQKFIKAFELKHKKYLENPNNENQVNEGQAPYHSLFPDNEPALHQLIKLRTEQGRSLPKSREIVQTIKTAIYSQHELYLKIKFPGTDLSDDVIMHPYVHGIDALNQVFIWGYLKREETFYKLYVSLITDAIILKETFLVLTAATYVEPDEDLITVVDGLNETLKK